MVTRYGRADVPGEVSGRRTVPAADVHIRYRVKNNCANCALKKEIQWFDGELFIHTCMTSPSKRADVTCQVKPEGWRAEPLFNILKTAYAYEKPKYEYWFIPYLMIKKTVSKSYRDTIDWRYAFAVTSQCKGFVTGSRVLFHCSNERLEYYAARGKPLWRHNGFVTSSMHSHDKTNERTLSYRCANNAIERCQSNYRK